MIFEPIAIIGEACLLPGALNPHDLWDLVVEGKDVLSRVPDDYWRTDPALVMADSPQTAQDQTWCDRGGYVRGFESVFDPHGFALPADEILEFDPLVHWILHTAREALKDSGYLGDPHLNAGAIFGNLSYPSHSMNQFSESIWLDDQGEDFLGGEARQLAGVSRPNAINRFMSGLPAHILARALDLNAGSFALDAACASSLYAIKLACDQLNDRRTDLMLAGGVNRADDLIIHIGFCVLQAMSRSGRSRPFHRDADGLVPAEGAGFVVLKRLDDAISAGDEIRGIIRAVGLSNDGRGQGLLVPSSEGQVRAIRKAYEISGLEPADISLVEGHATGTPVGDAVEIESMSEVFQGLKDIPIGTIKSNMGHPITVSGVAGLIKVLGAMKAGVRPPTLHVEEPIELLKDSPFRLITEEEPWTCDGPKRAVINNFGFGGNNAHLIVEEWGGSYKKSIRKQKSPSRSEIAIVGMGAVVADIEGVENFARAIFEGNPHLRSRADGTLCGLAEPFELPLLGLRFSPADLDQTLPQQLMVLKAAMEATAEVSELPRDRTGVIVGMGCDGEAARSGLCWRLNEFASRWMKDPRPIDIKEWVSGSQDGINPVRKAAAIIGAMPNIPANRLCSQFDVAGPSFTLSSEELSGVRGIDLAIRALGAGELDAALVGAVDLCCEPVHEAAAKEVLDEDRQIPGDAAIVLVLKRLEDARKDGNKIYAVFSDEGPHAHEVRLGLGGDQMSLIPLFGHAHAASGLLHIAAAALACYYRAMPGGEGLRFLPWLSSEDTRAAEVSINAMGGESVVTVLKGNKDSIPDPISLGPVPGLYVYSGADLQGVIDSLEKGIGSETGPARLVIVAANEKELADRRTQAQRLLKEGHNSEGHIELERGIYFRERPVGGEMAFVFTGSAGAYPGMGHELLLAFPDVMDEIHTRFASLKEAAGWVYAKNGNGRPTPEEMLWGSSFISQVHSRITQKHLGLAPDAVLGFSSGESNSLFAMGAWRDMDDMFHEFREMGVFTREVGGEFAAIRRAWEGHGVTDSNWTNWGLLVPEKEVLGAIETEPLVHLIIINAPGDVVIGGEAGACERVVKGFGQQRAYRLTYDVASHCPEIKDYADEWRKLHHRPTFPVPDVRFYTGATCSHYRPTADGAADALLGMASHTLDFPGMVEKAWNDGVRIFVEHGPRDNCTRWIRRILGDREHAAISMDRFGESSLIQVIHAMAQLIATGIHIDHRAITERFTSRPSGLQEDSRSRASRTYYVHPPAVKLPPIVAVQEEERLTENLPDMDINREYSSNSTISQEDSQVMSPAPWLPPVLEDAVIPAKKEEIHSNGGPAMAKILEQIVAQHAYISSVHEDFLDQQGQAHQRFLEVRKNALDVLMNAYGQGVKGLGEGRSPDVFLSLGPAVEEKDVCKNEIAEEQVKPVVLERPLSRPALVTERAVSSEDSRKPVLTTPDSKVQFSRPVAKEPCGPSFSREQLETFASGKISEVFGPLFEKQDGYARQVRLPEDPLLLADRVTGIEGEPGTMGKGIIWTETDVKRDGWYINDGYMPPGITVESGQCDLMLISWLGVDFLNKGERVYRLLGCDLAYYGTPPRAGDTLCYEIHVDGHANVGDVRIFFFHYDCRINGEIRLSVRNAQAGFFTDEELAGSGGVLWEPEKADFKQDARVDRPAVLCTRTGFSADRVLAFSEGRVYECFGPGFEISETHSKTPKIQGGQMRLIDSVTHFDPEGGPWKRGYLRVENQVPSDAWYLECHFKNDPCMPGTLMSDACLQAMSFYLTAMGYTLDKDGWRFEPVPDEIYHILCRGQVTPASKQLVYEVFVEEVIDGPYPTVYADVLGTCDGLKILHIRRMGLRLVPDWPLDCWPELLEGYEEKGTVATIGDMQFGYKSLLACAFGRPSDAFGELGQPFDNGRHISRLPGPPYHFMTRVNKIEAEMGAMKTGETIEVEYDVPPDAWYFDENGYATMPFCVLMEVALQPCGWLAVFEGGPLTSKDPLYFRNLDGTGSVTREILPETGTIRTRTTLTNISRISGITLVNFDVECLVGDTTVYKMETGFGFFPKLALDEQVGLPASDGDRAWLDEPCDFLVDLTERPDHYLAGEIRLPGPMLLMLDRVTGYWPRGGKKGLGRLRGEKSVNISEWFFKAHFFHDPVQPGSLGVESIVQLLQFYMLHENMHEGIDHPRFTPIALDNPTTWKYRGQVTPDKKRISVEMDIMEQGIDDVGPYAVAEAWLWADDLRIFHVKDLKMHIVPRSEPSGNRAHHSLPVEKPVVDIEGVIGYWHDLLGIGPWFGEDLMTALYGLFTRHLIFEDPGAFENMRGRSGLYLANHQVQIESMLFPVLMQAMAGPRMVTIANANHQNGWVGPLNDIIYSYPGMTYPENIVYFDQEDRESLFDIIGSLKSKIVDEGISVFLHVEGRLGLSCRNPVEVLSSVFIDMALESEIPIVPVRFVGGLPVEQMKATVDFPVGYGRQDYYVGRPILPEELEALSYAKRRKFVINAINGLGPPNDEEAPNPPNPSFGREVNSWIAERGSTEVKAVLFKALENMAHPVAEETLRLIHAANDETLEFGDDPKGRWLSKMAGWMFG